MNMEHGPVDRPLLEALDSVPMNGRAIWQEIQNGSRNIPYGNLCFQAANRIRELERDFARLRDVVNRVWAQTYGPGDDRTEIEVLEKRVIALADDRNAWKFNASVLEKERSRK